MISFIRELECVKIEIAVEGKSLEIGRISDDKQEQTGNCSGKFYVGKMHFIEMSDFSKALRSYVNKNEKLVVIAIDNNYPEKIS